jgi:threonine-phosphate decarboxylase
MRKFEHGGNPYAVQRATGVPLENLMDFSANINPLGPSKAGLDAMIEMLEHQTGTLTRYPDPDYHELKDCLARHHQNLIPADQIYPTNGGIEAIHDVFRALKPCKVMIVAPAFVEYEKAALAHAEEVVFHLMRPDNGFQLESETFLKAIYEEKPDLVVLGSPNNPTGLPAPRTLLKSAAALLGNWQGALLTDEAFMDFLQDESDWSMIDQTGIYPNLFVTRSLTKFYAVPGLRAGYLVTASEGFCDYWASEKPVWGLNTPAQVYVGAALADRLYIERTRRALETRKNELLKGLSDFSEIQVYPGAANFVLIQVRGPHQSCLKSELESNRILIRDCSNYQGLSEGYYRLGVLDERSVKALMTALKNIFLKV